MRGASRPVHRRIPLRHVSHPRSKACARRCTSARTGGNSVALDCAVGGTRARDS